MDAIHAVLFDMDGVIIDSEPVWHAVRVDVVTRHGGAWTMDDSDACRGSPSAAWSAQVAAATDGRLSADDAYDQVLSGMAAAYEEQLPVFPGAVDAVRRIAERYTVAVASGSPSRLIDVVLRTSGLSEVSTAVGYGDEVPKGKPAPDVYLDVLRRLEVDATHAVGVEDSVAGLLSLQAAGIRAIAVVSPEYMLPPEVLHGTVARLERLAELTVALLNQLP